MELDRDSAANLRLSRIRAEAVRDELRATGIDASRLTVEGFGASMGSLPCDLAEAIAGPPLRSVCF